jgi:sugar lactone lactonase YvrE
MEEAIDRFWDQIAQGRSPSAADLDAADAAAIRYLHANDDRPGPNSAFTRQLREELMHAHAIQVSSSPSAFPLPNGRSSRPWRTIPQPSLPAQRRVAAQLATAALVILALVGSFFAFGPGRHPRSEEDRTLLPAIGATPATPDAAAPIAEFVWGVPGTPDQPFGELSELTIDLAGNIWVPDAGAGQYLIFAPDGTFLEAWGTPGSGQGEFAFASEFCPKFGGVAFDASGAFYVADSGNFRVQKFGPDRAFLASWGSQGFADDQFMCPAELVLDQQGRVYVTDVGWGKVKVFDGAGAWLATWPGLTLPAGIAVDGAGNVWVADSGGSRVVKFAPDGERLAVWDAAGSEDWAFGHPSGLAIDAEGRVFVSDWGPNQVRVFAPDGTPLGAWGEPGDAPGQFQEPRGIALDGQGGVYVTEWAGNRVQKFRLLPPLG